MTEFEAPPVNVSLLTTHEQMAWELFSRNVTPQIEPSDQRAVKDLIYWSCSMADDFIEYYKRYIDVSSEAEKKG